MSSFLFLTFCVYVFRCLGLYFSEFILLGLSSGGFLPLPFKPPQEPHTASTGRVSSSPGVLSPTWLSKPHTGPHRGEFGFFLQNKLTPPPKGGGTGFCSSLGFRVLLGSCLWQPLATTGSHGPNRAGLGLRWCRFPTRLSKSHTGPHRGEFGTQFLFLVRLGFGRADRSFSSL